LAFWIIVMTVKDSLYVKRKSKKIKPYKTFKDSYKVLSKKLLLYIQCLIDIMLTSIRQLRLKNSLYDLTKTHMPYMSKVITKKN